jgi:hypothetical protein
MKILVVSHGTMAHDDLVSTEVLEELVARNHRVDVVTNQHAAWDLSDLVAVRRPSATTDELRTWLEIAATVYDGAVVVGDGGVWMPTALHALSGRIPTLAAVGARDLASNPAIPSTIRLIGDAAIAVHCNQKQRALLTELATMPAASPTPGARRELIIEDLPHGDPEILRAVSVYAQRLGYAIVNAGVNSANNDPSSLDGAAALVVAGPVQSWDRVFHALRGGIPLLVTTHEPELVALVESQRCGLVLTRNADCQMAVDLLGIPVLYDRLRRRAIETTAAMVCQTNASTIERLLDGAAHTRPAARPGLRLDETLDTTLLILVDNSDDLATVADVVRAGLIGTTLVVWLDPGGTVGTAELEQVVTDSVADPSNEPDILVVGDRRSPDNVESLLGQIDAVIEPSTWWNELAGAFEVPVIQLASASPGLVGSSR